MILLRREAGYHDDQRRLRIDRPHTGQGSLRDTVVDYLQGVCRTDSPLPCELALKFTYVDDACAEPAGETLGPAKERIPLERGAIEHRPAMRGKYAGNVMQPGGGTSQRAGLGGMRTHQVRLQLAQDAP